MKGGWLMAIVLAIFVAAAAFAVCYDTINKLSDEFGQDVSIVAPIAAATTITAIATCAMIWNWWYVPPMLILLFGILQKVQFSWWGYALLAILLIVSWVSAQMAWGGIMESILGRFILSPIAALLFIALSNWSRKEDKEASFFQKIEEMKGRCR